MLVDRQKGIPEDECLQGTVHVRQRQLQRSGNQFFLRWGHRGVPRGLNLPQRERLLGVLIRLFLHGLQPRIDVVALEVVPLSAVAKVVGQRFHQILGAVDLGEVDGEAKGQIVTVRQEYGCTTVVAALGLRQLLSLDAMDWCTCHDVGAQLLGWNPASDSRIIRFRRRTGRNEERFEHVQAAGKEEVGMRFAPEPV